MINSFVRKFSTITMIAVEAQKLVGISLRGSSVLQNVVKANIVKSLF